MVRDNNVPGPGNYNPNNVATKHSPAWKLSKESKVQTREGMQKYSTPGPGDYNSSTNPVKKTVPKYKFMKPNKTQKIKETSFSPGPGQYNSPPSKIKVGFTMGSKTNSQKSLYSSGSFTTADDAFYRK